MHSIANGIQYLNPLHIADAKRWQIIDAKPSTEGFKMSKLNTKVQHWISISKENRRKKATTYL
jgi:hypothetical protein